MNIKIICAIITIFQYIETASSVDMLQKNARQKTSVAQITQQNKPTIQDIIKSYSLNRTDYSILISIPKCGTHLMTRCLSLMNIRDFYFNPFDWEGEGFREKKQDHMRSAMKKNNSLWPNYMMGMFHIPEVGPFPRAMLTRMKKESSSKRSFDEHWPYSPEAEELFNHCTQANFFIIRDPRDMLISMAYMVHKGPDDLEANVNNLILDFIDGRQKSFIPWGIGIHASYAPLYKFGVTEFYKQYLPWMHARKFITIKFENLVGEEGGGNLAAQINEIKRMYQHLNTPVSDDEIKAIRENVFGKSSTFRSGRIGSWKKQFTQEMKDAYKKAPGATQLLIDLGYEKDANW